MCHHTSLHLVTPGKEAGKEYEKGTSYIFLVSLCGSVYKNGQLDVVPSEARGVRFPLELEL